MFCNLFLDLSGVLTYLCIDRLDDENKNVESKEILLEKIKSYGNDTTWNGVWTWLISVEENKCFKVLSQYFGCTIYGKSMQE